MSVHLDTDTDTDRDCVVTIKGEADLYAAAGVEVELVRLLHEGYTNIVVDLTGATFIDSTMLRVLLNTSKRLRPAFGQLFVVCHGDSTRKIFEVTLLDRVFKIFETRADALEYLAELRRLERMTPPTDV